MGVPYKQALTILLFNRNTYDRVGHFSTLLSLFDKSKNTLYMCASCYTTNQTKIATSLQHSLLHQLTHPFYIFFNVEYGEVNIHEEIPHFIKMIFLNSAHGCSILL